jgi:PAS domain S-box-containing protein
MSTPLRVLFVEDSEGDARLVALRLQNSGYDIQYERVATAEALSAALARQPWDIVIADYFIPSFGGLEALAMVQESELDLPFIIASGVIGEDVAVEAMKSGAYDYVMKDNLARLGAAVQRALQEADVRRARKQAEEELKRSEERYKLAQRAASIGSWDWDIITGKLHWSDQIEPMFGFAPGEFKATYEGFLECVHPDDRQYVVDSVNACVLEGQEYSIEHRIVWPDGSIHWVAETGDVVRDKSGKAIRMLGIARDITERRRAEEELTASEVRYRRLFETAQDGILLLDADTERITDVNPFLTELLNYSHEEMVGKKLWEISPFRDIEASRSAFRELQEESYIRYEHLPLETKDGRHIDVEFVSNVYRVNGRKVIQCNIRDITERRRAEEEVKRLAKFPAEDPYPVLRIAKDGTIVYANTASSSLLDVWQCHVGQLLPEDWRAFVSDVLSASSSKEVEVEVGNQIVSLTFAPVPGADYANAYGLDITERKRAGEEVRRLSRAIEQSPSMVVITDTQGHIEYVNPKFTQVTGYTADEVLGQNPRLLKSGEQPPEFYKELWETILAGREWRGEFANKRKDGEFFWELASISPVRNAEGVTTSFVKVAEDITSRKQSEEALVQYAAELQARNEELDAFAHTAAHDLKNPLGLIIGYAEVLRLDHADLPPEDVEKYVGAIARNGQRMSRIIDELLLLSGVRQVEIELEPLDMASIVTEAQQRLVDIIEEYQAEIIVPDTWPAALGYGPWIEEIWANYINNAIKYGGRPPRVELGAGASSGDHVRFWVRDNGPGIAPEKQGRLFTPFTRLDQVRAEGHGLGLSIVRRIVGKLGGEVGVESEIGQGSTFMFTLPAADTKQ